MYSGLYVSVLIRSTLLNEGGGAGEGQEVVTYAVVFSAKIGYTYCIYYKNIIERGDIS